MRIRFLHKRPKVINLGDMVCSPRYYFRFRAAVSGVTVLGGGAYGRCGVPEATQLGVDFGRAVAWGIGRSIKQGVASPIDSLPYRIWGLRDRDGVSRDDHFLPCVSCLHEMLDAPIEGDGTLLFLNADERVTAPEAHGAIRAMSGKGGWSVAFNNCSERRFFGAWRGASRVITNSYHCAYWSLLTGREVCIVGYSSKFSSVLTSVGLGASTLRWYKRGAADELIGELDDVRRKSGGARLTNADQVKGEFRQRNIEFAQRLVRAGLMEAVVPQSNHLRGSTWRYTAEQVGSALREMKGRVRG